MMAQYLQAVVEVSKDGKLFFIMKNVLDERVVNLIHWQIIRPTSGC